MPEGGLILWTCVRGSMSFEIRDIYFEIMFRWSWQTFPASYTVYLFPICTVFKRALHYIYDLLWSQFLSKNCCSLNISQQLWFCIRKHGRTINSKSIVILNCNEVTVHQAHAACTSPVLICEGWLMSLPTSLRANESPCNTAILIRATERESIRAKLESTSWESGNTDENGGILCHPSTKLLISTVL